MIDLAEVRTQFPQLLGIVPFRSGGQKEVCRAELNGKPVVLKLILPAPGAEDRAQRELEAVRQLSAPFVPRVLESGICVLGGQRRLFIIEEFIDGTGYRDVLDAKPVQDFDFVLDLAHVLVAAAVEFEKVRLVHRDIKPENIIVGRNGKIWILDFGIARHLNLPALTPSGSFGVGTIGYAAPEQYRNLKAQIDARADLFAIGIILHESLVGRHFYFDGASDVVAVMDKMDKVDLPRLALPEDPSNQFADFIASVCQRFPSRRPRNGAQALTWFDPIYKRLKATKP